MNINKIILSVCLAGFFLLFPVMHPKREKGYKEEWKQMEKFLRQARIVSIEVREDAGRTAPWSVTLEDGKTQRMAWFKSLNLSRPALLPDSYHYEIAAYNLSKLLEFPIVPPVVEREIEGFTGSLQLYLEDCIPLCQQERTGLEPPDSRKFANELDDLVLFENLSYCPRESSDILIHGEDWKVCRVDFSQAFAPERSLLPGSDIRRCSKDLYQILSATMPDDYRPCLEGHLNDAEILALLKRKDLILRQIERLVEIKGEEAVLFLP